MGVGVLGGVCALVTLALSPHAAGRTVAIVTPDGRTVTALFMEARVRPAPAVVLVPMLGRPKEDWEAVAQRLAEAGIASLAIDLPGVSAPADPQALLGWDAEVRAAVGYLATRPDEVRPGAVGLAGASLGASLVVTAAVADPTIRSIALVSPSLDYRGVRIAMPMREYGSRPALLVASLRDAYAARTVRELAGDPPGPRQVRWSEVTAHGTVLLARDPDLVGTLVEWFQLTLG